MIEVRWHGRAGQGAKTVSHLLAVAMLDSGDWVQAFPDYGPERSGAPMRAYNRSDTAPVRRRTAVAQPHAVVVLDESLVEEEDVTAGLKADGVLIVNTERSAADFGPCLRWRGKVLCVPAERIAAAAGVRRSNIVLLGALARVLGRPPLGALQRAVSEMMGEPRFLPLREATLAALAAGHEAGAVAPVETGGGVAGSVRRGPALMATGELIDGGVVEASAPRLPTGGWRSGEEPAVDYTLCVNCLLCWLACPDCAFALKRNDTALHLGEIDYGVCKGCELCVEVCPVDAVTMVPEGTHLSRGAATGMVS
jgi:pyruvate ferredoxin oxidoreductase gamma subunit